MKCKAFLSYSSEDRDLVEEFEKILFQLGIEVLRDRSLIKIDDDIEEKIEVAITKKADVFIGILTQNFFKSEWVKKEIALATQAKTSGSALDIFYVKLEKNIYLSDEYKEKLIVDFSFSKKDNEYCASILKLAEHFILRKQYRSMGVYNIYISFNDLDNRREKKTGEEKCSIDEFVECADKNIVAVGLTYKNLFGPGYGKSLSTFIKGNKRRKIDIYIPDLCFSPMKQLDRIHKYGGKKKIRKEIKNLIKYFKLWGVGWELTKSEAKRCRLHFLNFIPVNSFLCIDFDEPVCRMILDIFAVGIIPDKQMKIELRYPFSPLFTMYSDSLRSIMEPHRIIKSIYTSFLK